MTVRAAAIVLLVALTGRPAFVQATAIISGVVVSTDAQAQPIAGAIVTVSGGGIRDNVSAVTDDAGRFLFPSLTPGRYSVTASKPAYLTMAYGATRPGRLGVSVAAAAGQPENLRIALPRGAVIAGTVRDQLGSPAPDIQVMVTRADSPSSMSAMNGPFIENILTTDDRGMYRAYGLMPGEYLVAAMPLRFVTGEIYAPRRDEVDATLRRLEQRFAAGASVGADTAKAPPISSEAPFTMAPTFYPGTPIAADATRIRLVAGEERRGIDIQFVPLRTVKVSGMVQGGGPQPVRPQLIPMGPSQGIIFIQSPIASAVDGSFTFFNVAPGRYAIVARTGAGAAMRMPDAELPPQFASVDVTVGETDLAGVVLALQPVPALSGRVVFDGASTKPPVNLEIVRVSLVSVRPAADRQLFLEFGLANTSANVRSDGTFRFPGVLPGAYALASPFPGWTLRSVVVSGRDILDLPLEVEATASEITDAVVTFTDRRAELHGTLSTASGQPTSDFVVVVYPANREFWRTGARRIRSVRPGTDGAFSVMDLPTGEYLIAAVTDAEADEWQQPPFLEQLLPASVKVSIIEGQRTRQDLRIGR